MSNIDTIFQNVNLSGLKVSQIQSQGELVSLQQSNRQSIDSLIRILSAYHTQHSPNFGMAIPETSEIHTHTAGSDSDETVFSVTGQETVTIQSINVINAGASPATVVLKVNSQIIKSVEAQPAPIVTNVELNSPLIVDANLDFNFDVTVGTFGDITVKALTIKNTL